MHRGRVPVLSGTGVILFLVSCTVPPEFPVLTVRDQVPKQVVEILGEPDSAFVQRVASLDIFTQIYRDKYEVEIMYPQGIATDIVIHNPIRHLPFEASTLARFGIRAVPPTESMANGYIKWKDHDGFKTINFFVTDLDSAGRVTAYKIFFKSSGTTWKGP
jgi:hypothetical protein